jgi:arylsulfatase A-like enzyme
LIVVTGCARHEPAVPAAVPGVPVILISIDTLRSDRLPAYGYAKGSTPHIDRFRRDAILYQHAFSNCPQTLPAHTSLLTGTLPPAHGVRDNIGYQVGREPATLAARLRERGYRTGAAVSSYVLRRATGIDAGFEFFDDTLDAAAAPTDAERDGEKTRAALEQWLAAVSSRKVFALLHLYEPHAPYEAPNGFRRLADPYDNEIAYADEVVGRFLQTLRDRGLYDPALIILLSDHGEGLGDHGEDEHGVFVYRESLQVPLLVKLPDGARAGQTVERAAGLDEVFPTVLRVATGAAEASDLLSPSPRDIYAESYYARLHFGWSPLRALISGRRHFIDAPQPELYDYVRDPAETTNRAAEERRALFALQKKARDLDVGFQSPSAVDPEDQRKLAALGYLGSGGTSAPTVDPKSKLETLRALRRAFLLVKAERFGEAIPLLEEFVGREPGLIDGWGLLGRSRAATGRRREALAAYREGLRRFPENAPLALAAAQLYADAGQWDLAVRHAELALSRDAVLAHEMLARIAARRGDLDAAQKHAVTALEGAPSRRATLLLLADIMRRRVRPEEELAYLDRIQDRRIPGVEFRRGETLLLLRRAGDAEAAFRAEVTSFPTNREAWSSLALVVAAQGRRAEAQSILQEALRANPDGRMRALAQESRDAAGLR